MQVIDSNGNIFGGGIEITGPDGKPKTSGGGGSPTGPAGGDLSGSYPNPGVVWTNGIPTYDLQYYPLSLNPAGYLTSAALSGYLTAATAASTYYPIPTGTTAQYIRGDGTFAAFPTIPTVTPSALTKVDDTNVTLTLGGTPASALLQSVSLTLGWTGTLADSRIASASTWNAKQNAITLTTTGTSGAATLVGSTLNIPQYGGSSSLTIGTTAITSGTVGRILFEGTGNVLQESANLFWDNTNGRLGVGGSPGAFNLDVNGTARVNGDLSVTTGAIKSIVSSVTSQFTSYNPSNNYPRCQFQVGQNASDVNAGLTIAPLFSSTGVQKPTFIQVSTNKNISDTGQFSGYFTVNTSLFTIGTNKQDGQVAGGVPIVFSPANTEALRIQNNGNIGVNTTTDAGYKLDVNGTARVSGQITGQAQFTNSTSTSTNAILLNGINTTDTGTRGLINIGILSSTGILYGAIGIQATLQNYSVGSMINTNTVEGIGHMVNATSGTVAVNGFVVRTNGQGLGGSIGFTWRVGNSTHFWHSVYNDGTFGNLKLFNRVGDIYYVRDRDTTNITFGSSVYQASAQVAVDSTTKGFLPPRMTNAQMLAIATPAAGLIVYDTTNNKHCGYNGTAWQNFY